MAHYSSKMGSHFPDLQRELGGLNFSRQADLSQLIFDWSHLEQVIFVNNQPLKDILVEQNIETPELADAKEPILQKKFNTILQQLLPTQEGLDINGLLSQIPTMLHQGGLLSNLETHIVKQLTDQGVSLDNLKNGMERRIYLHSFETGFSIKEIFAYHGNVSQKDPEKTQFEQNNYKKPLLTGGCQYDIVVSKNTLHPTLKDFNLSSPEEKIEVFSGKKITIEATKNFKENYKEILKDNALDLSYYEPPFNN